MSLDIMDFDGDFIARLDFYDYDTWFCDELGRDLHEGEVRDLLEQRSDGGRQRDARAMERLLEVEPVRIERPAVREPALPVPAKPPPATELPNGGRIVRCAIGACDEWPNDPEIFTEAKLFEELGIDERDRRTAASRRALQREREKRSEQAHDLLEKLRTIAAHLRRNGFVAAVDHRGWSVDPMNGMKVWGCPRVLSYAILPNAGTIYEPSGACLNAGKLHEFNFEELDGGVDHYAEGGAFRSGQELADFVDEHKRELGALTRREDEAPEEYARRHMFTPERLHELVGVWGRSGRNIEVDGAAGRASRSYRLARSRLAAARLCRPTHWRTRCGQECACASTGRRCRGAPARARTALWRERREARHRRISLRGGY
jgi:hypothetical protein